MTLEVLAAGTCLEAERRALPVRPEWRKATRNMILALHSVEKARAALPDFNFDEQTGLVVGSLSGELEASAEFLTTWSKSGMARPMLFQNSLHNATTGFLSIHFQLTGPTFTVSSLGSTAAECLHMAGSLLLEGACRICIVTLVEVHRALADAIGVSDLSEGACTLLVTLPGSGFSRRTLHAPFAELALTVRERPLQAISDSGFFKLAQELER